MKGSIRLVWILTFLAPATLPAQLPVARLLHLFPPGAQAGSEIEIAVGGNDLDDPTELHFSHPGIVGKPNGGKFNVTIASNVPPGLYEARFSGRFGMSNPRGFEVGRLPELIGPSTNTSAATAFELPFDSTLNGRMLPNSAAWFKFTAKQGRRLFVECLADSLDSRLEPTVIVLDPRGRELERNRTGGFLDFTPPADGEYRVRVADVLYRGGDDYVYRLTLSTGPHLDFVLPPVGVPGTTSNFIVFGRNLPGGQPVKGQSIDGKPLEQLSVPIHVPDGRRSKQLDADLLVPPSAAGIDGLTYRLSAPRGLSNPLLIGFATTPAIVAEREPNNRPVEVQKIHPPCEIAGQFFPAGDVDMFGFDAKKGDVFWVEVFSQRLGLPTDPTLIIQRITKNEKGAEQAEDVAEVYDNDTNLGDREFNTASRDPVTRFEAKENGTYRITVRDTFGLTRASPRHVYRLAVRRETPDFRLVALAVAPKFKSDSKDVPVGVPLLRRGESIAVRVMAFRRDGFNGDIELSVENPPPGLIFAGDRMESGKSTDYILLTAADDAPGFAGAVRLVGRARIDGKEMVREVRGGTMRFQVPTTDAERPRSRVTAEFTLAICDKEQAPVIVAAIKPSWEAAEKTKIEIPLRITRHADFSAAFKLKPLGPGAQDSLKDFDVDARSTNVTLKLDLAALKLGPGSHAFAVQGIIAGKYRNNPEGAAAADSAAKEAEKASSEAVSAAKKAAEDSDKAARAAKEAETALAAVAAKLAAAKESAEKSSDDEKAKSILDALQKDFDDASAKSKSAAEMKAAAEKALAAAETKSKAAQSSKEEAARRAKEMNEKARPRDVNYQVTSAPFTVVVTPAPVAKSKESKEAQQAKTK